MKIKNVKNSKKRVGRPKGSKNKVKLNKFSEEYFKGTSFLSDELLIMNGFDDCIMGVVERFGNPPIVAYDKEKVLSRLMNDDMTYEDAVEFFEFNQIGAWVGDKTPCFFTSISSFPI